MKRLSKLAIWLRERGLLWTTLHVVRRIVAAVVHALERLMIRIEQKRLLTGEGTVSSSYHTVHENRRRWEVYDWTQAGEKLRGSEVEGWAQRILEAGE